MTTLDAEEIRQPITGMPRDCLDDLEVFDEIASTNSYLLGQPAPVPGRYRVALAEYQTAGRGRLDRHWESPPAGGLCLSMAYTFRPAPEHLSCLTLALGTGVVAALERFELTGVSLKWPNDVIACGGKIGGILTELVPGSGDERTVVIGVGLNVALGEVARASIAPGAVGRIADLSCLTDAPPSRQALSVALIEQLFDTLTAFDVNGFPPFRESWLSHDWLEGRDIVVEQADGIVRGVASGVDDVGALLVATNDGMRRIVSGSVMLVGGTG